MESNKGKPMASYNGYLMHQTVKSANGTKQFWRCATRSCHGTAESVFGELNGLVERKSHDRCTQSPMAVVIKKKMTAVKRKAVESLATSTQAILSTVKTGASVYEIESMPQDSNIKRMINNARKPKGASDVDKELKDVVLSYDFTITAREERFLLWDSRVADSKKPIILIFASAFGLQLLERYRHWSMDGTFYSLCTGISLAEAIYGEEDLHAQVRMEMMSFLLQNREKPYASFFTAIGEKSVTVEEYAAHFNQPSNEPARWGTSQQLVLAAKLYDKNMILFQPKDAPQYVEFSVDSFEDEPKKVFRANGQVKRVYKTGKVLLKPGVNSVLIRYQNSHFDLGWIGQN